MALGKESGEFSFKVTSTTFSDVPKEYLDGVKYGSPAGLMMIMR